LRNFGNGWIQPPDKALDRKTCKISLTAFAAATLAAATGSA
jgi:hypothetical protein